MFALLMACEEAPPPKATAPVDNAQHFRFTLHGQAVHLAVDDCTVYLVQADTVRERILKPPSYPLPSICQRQEISADSEYIHVELGRQAFGAGGCCATEGTWRSRNGTDWQRREKHRWVPEGIAR